MNKEEEKSKLSYAEKQEKWANVQSIKDLYAFKFLSGKYEGQTYGEVKEKDPSYILYLLGLKRVSDSWGNFLKWVELDKITFYEKAMEDKISFFENCIIEFKDDLSRFKKYGLTE